MVELSCFGKGEPIYQGRQQNENFFSFNQFPQKQLFPSSDTPKSSPTRRISKSSSFNHDSVQKVSAQVAAYHFCQAENVPSCSVAEFVHSLAAQLSQAPFLRPYYNLMMTNYQLRTKLTMGHCLARPDQALEEGILEPLRSVQGVEGVGSQPCLIIVDGLCDSELHRPDRGDTIGSFISKHLDAFPPWIKFVCTVRSDAKGMRAAKGLPFHQIRSVLSLFSL